MGIAPIGCEVSPDANSLHQMPVKASRNLRLRSVGLQKFGTGHIVGYLMLKTPYRFQLALAFIYLLNCTHFRRHKSVSFW